MMRVVLRRLREADILDWLFGLLFAVVGAAIAISVYANIVHDPHDPPFEAVSFEAPALVVNSRNVAPKVPGLPSPSVYYTEEIPVRLTRYIDCAAYDCPAGGIPLTVEVIWEEVGTDGGTIRSFLIAEDIPVVYEEGTDYRRGELVVVTNRLTPFSVPSVVVNHIERQNKYVSAWRISGVNTILGESEAAWSTEVIHVVYPPASDEEDG